LVYFCKYKYGYNNSKQMKKLFLASSFKDVAHIFKKFANEELKGKRVSFIPTASIVESYTAYVNAGKEALEQFGLHLDLLEISELSSHEVAIKLKQNDYIYVSGGNTFFLLQELKRTGVDKLIVEQINAGKLYIGESAGSIILSPNIQYVNELDDSSKATDLENFDALHVVDFYPLPHHTNFPFIEAVENTIEKYQSTLNLLPISNSQVIIIKDSEIKVETI